MCSGLGPVTFGFVFFVFIVVKTCEKDRRIESFCRCGGATTGVLHPAIFSVEVLQKCLKRSA